MIASLNLFLHYILLIFQVVEITGGGGYKRYVCPPPPNIFIGGGSPPPPPPPQDRRLCTHTHTHTLTQLSTLLFQGTLDHGYGISQSTLFW